MRQATGRCAAWEESRAQGLTFGVYGLCVMVKGCSLGIEVKGYSLVFRIQYLAFGVFLI